MEGASKRTVVMASLGQVNKQQAIHVFSCSKWPVNNASRDIMECDGANEMKLAG
jgi:hypothetical protein